MPCARSCPTRSHGGIGLSDSHIDAVRTLVQQGKGRHFVAETLGISNHRAQVLIAQVKKEGVTKPPQLSTSVEVLSQPIAQNSVTQTPQVAADTLRSVLQSGKFTLYELCERVNAAPRDVRQLLVELAGVKKDGERFWMEAPQDVQDEIRFVPDGNEAEVSYKGRKQITTLEELLAVAKVDTTIWHVEEFTVNQWEMGYVATKIDGIATPDSHPLFQVKARLRRIKLLPVEFEPIAPVRVEVFHRAQPAYEPSTIRRCAVIPDIQVGYRRDLMYGTLAPFHDRAVIDVGLQMLADIKPDVVVFLGDNADLPDWSLKYLSTPECQQITQTTLIELAWIYGKVRATCPSAEIHVIEGNHDARLQTAVAANLRQAYGLRAVDQLEDEPALSMPRLLNLDALGIAYHGSYPHGRYRLNSNFLFHHGKLVRSQSGKTVAAAANDLRRNEAFGHIHRVECASKTMWTADDGPRVYQAWSFGTWASILPGVVPGNSMEPNWQNAMGRIDYEVNASEGENLHDLSTVTPILIYKDAAIYDGKRYKARPQEEILAEIVGETNWDVTRGFFRARGAQ